jgi:predicted dehydrogenase
LGFELDVHAFRKIGNVLEDEISGLISRQINDINQLDNDYDITFVTNPTNMHYDTIKLMAGKTKHMFIEKPIFDSQEYSTEELNLDNNGVYYVAGPLRFSGVIEKLKDIIQEEKIYCAKVICSSYLPDWRPNVDYRQVYSARKSQGGGVAIDLIHEWDYIIGLFGLPKLVYSIVGKYSQMEIDSEDLAVYIADYKDKVIELHLDYFGRVPRREIEIFTEKGTVTGDLVSNNLSFTDGRDKIHFCESKNDIYLKEMKFFIDNVLLKNSFNNLNYCHDILKIALGKKII